MKTPEEIKDQADNIYPTTTNAIYEVNIKRVKELQNEAFCVGAGYALSNLWIDTNDREPQSDQQILICSYRGVDIGNYYNNGYFDYEGTKIEAEYWMNIPETPKL